MKNITIEQKVMANVGTIYTGRVLTGATALKLYALVLSLWGIGRLVWVSKIFDNFFMVEKGGASAITNYLETAVTHTHFAVQVALLVAVVAFVSLFADAVRKLAEPSRTFAV